MQKVKNTLLNFVKLSCVSLLFFSVSHVALAYTSDITHNGDNLVVTIDDFDYTGYPCVEGFPPFNVPVVGYQIKLFENNGAAYDPESPDLVSPVYTGDSVSTFYAPSDFDVLAVLMSCVPQNPSDQYYSEILESGVEFDPFSFPDPFTYNTLYTITGSGNTSTFYDSATAGGGGGSYEPPHFDLIGGTDLLASVGGSIRDGVQETGKSMWPLLVFLGVALAFIIALQLVVFTRRTIGTPKEDNIDPGYGPEHPDYRAYKRGREIIEKEHPNFYKD